MTTRSLNSRETDKLSQAVSVQKSIGEEQCCRFRQSIQTAASFSTKALPISARMSCPTLSRRCLDNSTSAIAQCAGSNRPISTTLSREFARASGGTRSETGAAVGFKATNDMKIHLDQGTRRAQVVELADAVGKPLSSCGDRHVPAAPGAGTRLMPKNACAAQQIRRQRL
jgi:hypothetical protein